MVRFLAASAALALAAVPASAVTYDLSGPLAYAQSFTYTSAGNPDLVATGYTYTVSPTALTQLSQLTIVNPIASTTPAPNNITNAVRRSPDTQSAAGGLGIRTNNENSGEWDQIDTNPSGTPSDINEALYFSLTGSASRLVSATFNYVDADDTLRVYGVSGGTLTYLGFAGEFFDNTGADAPMSGGATIVSPSPQPGSTNNDLLYTVNFSPVLGGRTSWDGYLFTSNNNAADGYRITSINLAAVPEAGTWAMMVFGFGMMGAALRRRRPVTSIA